MALVTLLSWRLGSSAGLCTPDGHSAPWEIYSGHTVQPSYSLKSIKLLFPIAAVLSAQWKFGGR